MHASDPSVVRSRRGRLQTLTAGVALVLASSCVVAALASAASVSVGQACVVNANPARGSPMTVNGAGFTPGDVIDLQTTNGGAFGTATADSLGGFSIFMSAPTLGTLNPAASAFVLQAQDQTDGTTTTTTNFGVTNLAVATNPSQGKPSKEVTWSFSGFTVGAEIYAHYLHGKQVTATAKFGRAAGPCGTLKTKAVFYPGRAKYDVYKLQIDDSRRYSPGSLPRLSATLRTHIPL